MAKDIRLTWRPNQKARFYLGAIGYLDHRTGNKRKTTTVNVNDIINRAFINLCESEMTGRTGLASVLEIKNAYYRYRMREINCEKDALSEEQLVLQSVHQRDVAELSIEESRRK